MKSITKLFYMQFIAGGLAVCSLLSFYVGIKENLLMYQIVAAIFMIGVIYILHESNKIFKNSKT